MKTVGFLVVGALFALILIYLLSPDRSIPYADFQPRFFAAVGATHLQIIESRLARGESVPAPWAIRWHPSRWRWREVFPLSGFPDAAELYRFRAGESPPVDCFVRYLDSRAVLIAIRSHPGQESLAETLRSALSHEFPELAVTSSSSQKAIHPPVPSTPESLVIIQ